MFDGWLNDWNVLNIINLKNLKELEIKNNVITYKGLQKLLQLPYLTYINIDNNGINREQFIELMNKSGRGTE